MSSSHETCPICHRELVHAKYLNRPCKIAGGQAMSFLESTCNNVDFSKPSPDYPFHLFFQVSSLYETKLFESVSFPDINRLVSVNYVTMTSEITYYGPSDTHFITSPHAPTTFTPPQIVTVKNKVLTLDYPKLEKIRDKIRILAPFL